MLNLAKKLAQIFFGVQSVEEMKRQGLALSLAVPAFRWADWALVGVTGVFVVALKGLGISDIGIFLILWLANILIELLVVKINDKTKIDFTLMEGLRRLANAATQKSKTTGVMLEMVVFIRLLIWDGSAFVVIFFNHKFRTFPKKFLVLVVCSGIQMLAWTTLYIFGYNSFTDMVSKMFH